MTVIEAITQALREHPDGLSRQEIARVLAEQDVKVPSDTITRRLTDLRNGGKAWKDAEGIWHIGVEAEERKSPEVPVPGEYEEFRRLGEAVGMTDPLLEAMCRYVFSADSTDLRWVWEALSSMHLRPDITRRWFRLWSMAIKQPIPEELKEKVEQAEKPGTEAAFERKKLRYTVVGNKLFVDPEGQFEKPQEALAFIETQRAVSGQPGSAAADTAEIVRAIGELGKGTPNVNIDIAELVKATKPDYETLLNVVQSLQPPPPPEKTDTLSTILSFLKTNPDAISTALGMVKRVLGIDQIESRIASIGNQSTPMIQLGEGGLSLPDYKELWGFIGDQKRADNEEKRRDEAHKEKLGFIGELREKVPQVLSAAERAVARMEQREAAAREAPAPAKRAPAKAPEMFQASCPQCGTVLTGPPESMVVCPECSTSVLLTKTPPTPEANTESKVKGE